MNWKKILAYIVGSTVVGGMGGWLGHPSSPLTIGTIGPSAVAALIAGLSALFTQPPHKG